MNDTVEQEEISGIVVRCSPPIKWGEQTCIIFCIYGEERIFSAGLVTGYSGACKSLAVALIREGDEVRFTLHPKTLKVCDFSWKDSRPR